MSYPHEYFESAEFEEDWNEWRELANGGDDFGTLDELKLGSPPCQDVSDHDEDEDDALNEEYRAAYKRFRASLGSKQQKRDVPFERFVFYVVEAQRAGFEASLDPTNPDPSTDFLPAAHLYALRVSCTPFIPSFFAKLPTPSDPVNDKLVSSPAQRREQKRKQQRKAKKALARNQSSTPQITSPETQAPATTGTFSKSTSCNLEQSVPTTTTSTAKAPATKGPFFNATSCNRDRFVSTSSTASTTTSQVPSMSQAPAVEASFSNSIPHNRKALSRGLPQFALR